MKHHKQSYHYKSRNTVLFVDDEKICHDFIHLIIPHFTKYQIISAYSGEQALDILRQHQQEIGLIFLDILLPDARGYEVYKQMKDEEILGNIPVVFQSGISYEDHVLSQNCGILNPNIIHKPYDKEELILYINKFMVKADEVI